MTARALVTGAAGFLGSHVCDVLLAEGWSVSGLDDLSAGSWDQVDDRVAKYTADVRDVDAVETAADGATVVLHLAALGSVPRSFREPRRVYDVNVGGTAIVADAALRRGARLVLASSSSVYGGVGELFQCERATPSPRSPYAVSKLAAETHARMVAADCVVLRLFNVFGPRQTPDGPYAAVVPRFCRQALAGGALTVHGDGLQSRDFCFVEDAARAFLLAAVAPRGTAVWNVGGGTPCTVLDIAQALEAELGRELEKDHVAARPGDVRHSNACRCAATGLGFSARVPWREGLRRTLEWHRQRDCQ